VGCRTQEIFVASTGVIGEPLPHSKITKILPQLVESGAAGNWFMDHRGKTMLAGTFPAGFKVNLHHKDLQICMAMARQNGDTSLPLTAMTAADYERLMAAGYGDEDISALYRLKKK
jgi:3-hydroxyisobutyrate dehydrogenase